jgi:dihydrofolate reductase
MNISLIVAMDKNRGIGKDNTIPWYISEDLKRFKRLTTGNVIIMGKNTWFSLPRRPLPNRKHIVLTSSAMSKSFEGAIICDEVSKSFDLMDEEKENFIIGGASIYKAFLPYADKIYLTIVHKAYEVDTFFPEIIEKNWELLSKEDFFEEKTPYSNFILKKIAIL